MSGVAPEAVVLWSLVESQAAAILLGACTTSPARQSTTTSTGCFMALVTSFVFNVTFDCADPRRAAAFWAAATGYETAEERDDFVRLRATDPRGVRHLLFFRVPEPKAGKNRVHVDLATGDPEAEITRLVALGATRGEHRSGNGTSWTVMHDPEGNEFCLG